MTEDLVIAVRCKRKWIDRFTRFEYREAFAEYKSLYAEAFLCELEKSSPEEFADKYIGLISDSISKERFFGRASCRVDCQMTIITFLCPMLESIDASAYASSICTRWNKEFKDEKVSSTDYNTLLNGFRNSVLGIDLENKHFSK